MFRGIVDWWYSTPATPASSALAAPSVAHPKQHPAASASSDIITALASGAMNAAMSRPAVTDGSDELGIFQQSIKNEITKLTNNLTDWRQRKIQLLGQEENIPQSAVVLGRAKINNFSDLLRLIKDDLVEMVMTPSAEIKALLQRVRPELEAQQRHVNELVTNLDATKDKEEKKKIKVQICDINIDLLQEFIQMIHDINVKIQSALTLELLGEKVALSVLSTTLLLMAQIAFPQMDAEVEVGLRDYMGRSIRSEGSELDNVLTQLEGEIAQAWRHVASDQVHNTDAADATTSSADAGASPADAASVVEVSSPSATGLFAVPVADVRTAAVDVNPVPSAPALK